MNSFLSFLNQCVSPAHTVSASCRYLSAQGFTALDASGDWTLVAGGRYYVPFYDTSLVAFTVAEDFSASDGFHIAAAHTDWPCLRIKPQPEMVSGGCCRLNIEPYGGAIYSTWFDRPLSMAGLVSLRTDDPMHPDTRLFSFDRPMLTIPNVAIHMNREVNKGVALKPNVDLLPLCRTVAAQWEKDGYLLRQIADLLGCAPEEILSYDLCVFNAEPACLVGLAQDMISAPRLDNLTSVYACLHALAEQPCSRGVNVCVLYDNEEVGSNTKQGADSAMLTTVLEKAAIALSLTRTQYLNALMRGMLLSCDVAHAAHPNHMELSDPSCQPQMNGGVVIKMNFNQSYPTDAAGTAMITGLCRANSIPFQTFMNRADLRGGSTIGAMASARMTMRTVDVGVPILAMHSARELMGAQDQQSLTALVSAFYRT